MIFLVNFGSPRVGNLEFTKFFEENIKNSFRIVNFKDMVPHLPPEDIGFKHIGTEVWMLENGSIY
jgi:predicted lipase